MIGIATCQDVCFVILVVLLVPNMRLLNILLLAGWFALPHIAAKDFVKWTISSSFSREAMSDEILSWAGMVGCKAEYMRVREDCLLHDVTPENIAAKLVALLWSLAATCTICFVAFMAERRRHIVDKQDFADREKELLERVQGIQAQAFNLGKKATQATLELAQVRFELARTRTERDDARKQSQALVLGWRQQASDKAERHRQADIPASQDPPPLAGECSTPELEQLVAHAVNSDAAHGSVDQCYTTPVKAASGAKPNVSQDQEKQWSARLPAAQETELPDIILAEEGRCYSVAKDTAETSQKLSVQSTTKSTETAATTATQTQKTSTATAAPAVAVTPQPVQLQLQIVHPSGSSLLTREDLHAELDRRDVEQLKAEKMLLTAETQQLKLLKVKQLNDIAEAQGKVLQPSPVASAYVNTSRGTHTPLPFGSPLPAGQSEFSPFAFSPQFSSGGAMQEPTNSSAAASTYLRSVTRPSSMSPPGSAGSNVLQSPLQQAGVASPYTGSSSAASAVAARSAQQVQPLPMRSLESPGNSQRSTRMASPAHEKLKADAEYAAKRLAQRAEEVAKQRQGFGKMSPGSAGKVN